MAKKPTSEQDQTQTDSPVLDIGDEGSILMSKSDILDIIREIKKPDPEMAEKAAKEKARLEQRRQRRVRIAQAEERAKIARQRACQHRKPNGEETSGGQPFSDGRTRIFCLRCQAILREYWSPEVARGMLISKRMQELGITDDDIKKEMDVRGAGVLDPDLDIQEDIGLMMPRGAMTPSLTTES